MNSLAELPSELKVPSRVTQNIMGYSEVSGL